MRVMWMSCPSSVIGHDYDDVYVLYFELSERRGTSTVQSGTSPGTFNFI